MDGEVDGQFRRDLRVCLGRPGEVPVVPRMLVEALTHVVPQSPQCSEGSHLLGLEGGNRQRVRVRPRLR